MSGHEEQAEVLIAAGSRDELSLQLLIQTERAPHETSGFLAQQAWEKYIKAGLVLKGIYFERTHDLVALSLLAEQRGIKIPVNIEVLRALNSYAVQFRYEGCPVVLIEPKACESVTNILANWARTQL